MLLTVDNRGLGCKYSSDTHAVKGDGNMDNGISANDFCRNIWKLYLEERRYDLVGDYISDRISVIGTGAHEVERNLDEFLGTIEQESREWNGRFTIQDQWYQTTELSDKHSFVMGELIVRENAPDGILYDMRFRFTVVLERSEHEWKVLHIHQSVPDPNQTRDEFFPHHMVEQTHTQIIYNLRHDSLTGLLNRLYFKETCERFLASGDSGAFLMMDLDCFKQVNDQYGHPDGDKVLISFSESLKAICFSTALAGRMGGDEFAVFLSGFNQKTEVETFFDRLKKDWQERQIVLPMKNPLSVSVGVVFSGTGETSCDSLLNKADQALYESKKEKGTELIHWAFYTADGVSSS